MEIEVKISNGGGKKTGNGIVFVLFYIFLDLPY